VDFRVVVLPVHFQLWRVVDSAHPQLRVEYAQREDAIDCARGLAADNAPALIEVLSPAGEIVLRERYERSAEGTLTVDLQSTEVAEEFSRQPSRRSAG
jgi:hypothetical protein